MSWEEKLSAFNALCDASLKMRKPGDWYVSQRTEIGGNGFLEGRYGNGSTPEEAVLDHWRQLVEELPRDRYIAFERRGKRTHVRWNGHMWEDLMFEPQPQGDGE